MSDAAPGTATPTPTPATPAAPGAGTPAAAPGDGDGAGGTPADGGTPSVLGGDAAPGTPADPVAPGASKDATPDAASDLKITLPQGVEMDATVLADITGALSKAGLDSEKASELVAFQLQREAAVNEAAATAWADKSAEWHKELATDKDFGGEHLEKNTLNAQKGLKRFDPEGHVSTELKRMGLDNFPPFVKMFAKIGDAIGEDSSGGGGGGSLTGPGADRQAQLRKQYPSMFNQDGSPKT